MSALRTFLTVSISDWLFEGELPPVFDSVGVNSKENFCKCILEVHEFFSGKPGFTGCNYIKNFICAF